ncbi:MAG: RNA pyrophosphohydrolase [Proteobacteria bacterium]|nr:MAG: RNA pyrophosphohydrolase [Pseudomonadota bacterium]
MQVGTGMLGQCFDDGNVMEKPYRPCVVAVIRNDKGQLLAGERADQPGSWQLPQGGIDEGETATVAVIRELHEEIGSSALSIKSHHTEWIRYQFPAEFANGRMAKWAGQEQQWFLLEFKPGEEPHLDQSEGEFQALKWVSARELLDGIVYWKKEAYAIGLAAFGLI